MMVYVAYDNLGYDRVLIMLCHEVYGLSWW